MSEGYYYLHENGSLIYKRELGGTAADLRESTFVRMFWPLDTQSRANAWQVLIEALACGANPERVKELAAKWECDNEDAQNLADLFGLKLFMDGDQCFVAFADFENLMESKYGFGDTYLDALAMFTKQLDWRPAKMWGQSVFDIFRKHRAKVA